MTDPAEDLGIEFNHKITMSHQSVDKAQCDTAHSKSKVFPIEIKMY